MEVINKIMLQQQLINRLERHATLTRIKQRKTETRRKIEFGGLVIKSKMDNFSKAIILGALIDAVENIKKDGTYSKWYQSKGESAFMEF